MILRKFKNCINLGLTLNYVNVKLIMVFLMPGIGGFFLSSPRIFQQTKQALLNTMIWDANSRNTDFEDHNAHFYMSGITNDIVPVSLLQSDHRWYSIFYGELHLSDPALNKTSAQHNLIHLGLIQHGMEYLNDLEGTFLFALWDKQDRELLIANDAFGQFPLHWHQSKDFFVFSSQANAIANAIENRDLNVQALSEYLAYGIILSGKTWFKEINKLPPGHYLQLKHDRINRRAYYSPKYLPLPHITLEELTDLFINRFESAIQSRWDPTDRTGVALTGGFDTRIIWSVYKKNNLQATAVTHGLPGSADIDITGKISKYIEINHRQFYHDLTLKHFPEWAAQRIKMTEGFMNIDSAYVLPYYQWLRESFNVLIDGAGGPLYRRQVFRNYGIEKLINRSLADFMHHTLLKSHFHNGIIDSDFVNNTQKINYSNLTDYFSSIAGRGTDEDLIDLFYFDQYIGLRYSADIILQSQFIKCRQPLQDRKLFDLVRQFSAHDRRKIFLYKNIIRKFEPRLEQIPLVSSSTIIPYRGFLWKRWLPMGINLAVRRLNLPGRYRAGGTYPVFDIAELYSTSLNGFLHSVLLDPKTISRTFWNGKHFENLIKEHQDGHKNHANVFNTIITAELFLREFMD